MSLLKEIAGHPEFLRLHKQAEQIKPQLPRWQVDPISGKDNTEEWKRCSAMLEGFENALQIFTPK